MKWTSTGIPAFLRPRVWPVLLAQVVFILLHFTTAESTTGSARLCPDMSKKSKMNVQVLRLNPWNACTFLPIGNRDGIMSSQVGVC